MMKIKKLIGYKTLGAKMQQLLQEYDELGQILSTITICMHNEFKVTTPENPLLSKQAVTSKRNPST